MSVWGDVRRRADGKDIRKENKYVEPPFPKVEEVYAKTFSSNIIPVKPMDPPRGVLTYFDYFR